MGGLTLLFAFRNAKPVVPEGQAHPCAAVVTDVAWPHLSRTLTAFRSDARVMERGCRCIRFAIRCLRTQFGPILPRLAEQMVAIYREHPHSCFLYLGSILVRITV